MKIKRFGRIMVAITLSFMMALPTTAMAADETQELATDSEVWNVDLSEDTTEYKDTTEIQPITDGY